MSTLRDELLRFVTELRAAGVRISVAETLDAMNAVVVAGIGRERMREALAATLVKDEADRVIFDELFAAFFRAPLREGRQASRKRPGERTSAAPSTGGAPGESFQAGRSVERMRPDQSPEPRRPRDDRKPDAVTHKSSTSEEQGKREAEESRGESARMEQAHRESAFEETSSPSEAGRRARLRTIERTPFSRYSDLEYEQARDALLPIARRFRVRLGRRLRHAKAGRIDFRRTIRASIQRGGTFSDLRFRARRPRRVDLLILADISGSVKYSSTLMLELIAGAQQHFHRVRSFVYIDSLAEADFENGHLVMTPPLDLYARSDFGRVLSELWERRGELLSRATVLVIMGDGRNNRRPARADLLRQIGRLCRAVIWLMPEERERWGTGDSAIFQYARELTALVPSQNLYELERGLAKVA